MSKDRYELKIYSGCESYYILDRMTGNDITLHTLVETANNSDKQLAELKANNEMLKQQNERVLHKLELMVNVDQENERLKAENEKLNNALVLDHTTGKWIKLCELQQQLKEKDEEIEKLKDEICKYELVLADKNSQLKEKDEEIVKCWGMLAKSYTDKQVEDKLKANTHQVCEKIREKLINIENDGECKINIGISTLIDFDVICEILDQVEKGEI